MRDEGESLRKNPESRREVVGQVLEYASHMAHWSAADVERIAVRFFSSDQVSSRRQRARYSRRHNSIQRDSGPPTMCYSASWAPDRTMPLFHTRRLGDLSY